MKQSGKLTIVDLVAIVLLSVIVVGLLMSLFGGNGGRAREFTQLTLCGNHLHDISKAIQLYYSESSDHFPTVTHAGDDEKTGLGFTGIPESAPSIYGLTGAFPQDSLCSALVYRHLITWEAFLCPATRSQLKDRSNPADAYGFGAGASPANAHKNFIDYGLQIPQHYTAPGVEHKGWLDQNAEATLATMADRPPTPDKLATEWSPNHPKDGANVMFFGGTVKLMDSHNGTITGPGGAVYRNFIGRGPNDPQYDKPFPNNIYTKDMGPDTIDINYNVLPGEVHLGVITPPGPTESRYDSVIYWRSNP
jgi:hypothetical protein